MLAHACRKFPRVGAYMAVAVQGQGGSTEALLCADSLNPAGSGQQLSEGDR